MHLNYVFFSVLIKIHAHNCLYDENVFIILKSKTIVSECNVVAAVLSLVMYLGNAFHPMCSFWRRNCIEGDKTDKLACDTRNSACLVSFTRTELN